jgi:hypothetical protein
LRSRVSFKKIPSRVFFQTIMLGLWSQPFLVPY